MMQFLAASLVFLVLVLVIVVLMLVFAEPAAKAIGRFLVRVEHYKQVFGHTSGKKPVGKPTAGLGDVVGQSEMIDRRRQKVLDLLGDGLPMTEIADTLDWSYETIKADKQWLKDNDYV